MSFCLCVVGLFCGIKHTRNAVNIVMRMCFLSQLFSKCVKLLNRYQICLQKGQTCSIQSGFWPPTGVALRHLQCNNVRLHIHSAGNLCCLNPAASSVSHSSVRKALYISPCCALSIALLLFPFLQSASLLETDSQMESSSVRFRKPLLSSLGSSLSLSWLSVAMATV